MTVPEPADVEAMITLATTELRWQLVPLNDRTERSLIRRCGTVIDVVTFPADHYAIVVRVEGEVDGSEAEVWRHFVPVALALLWINSDPSDDAQLVEWEIRSWEISAPRPRETP